MGGKSGRKCKGKCGGGVVWGSEFWASLKLVKIKLNTIELSSVCSIWLSVLISSRCGDWGASLDKDEQSTIERDSAIVRQEHHLSILKRVKGVQIFTGGQLKILLIINRESRAVSWLELGLSATCWQTFRFLICT